VDEEVVVSASWRWRDADSSSELEEDGEGYDIVGCGGLGQLVFIISP
jgi:hypothetical protein